LPLIDTAMVALPALGAPVAGVSYRIRHSS